MSPNCRCSIKLYEYKIQSYDIEAHTIHIYMYRYKCICIYWCIRVYVYIYVYVCICMCIYVHTFRIAKWQYNQGIQSLVYAGLSVKPISRVVYIGELDSFSLFLCKVQGDTMRCVLMSLKDCAFYFVFCLMTA